MEVNVVSREAIKPGSLPKDNIPLKISLLDQLTPATQGPCVFFYAPISNPHVDTLLKTSLSKTLTPFYPFSGRVSDNLHVSDFDSGVPFLEARATCTMSHYLMSESGPDLSTLNKLLPSLPFRDDTSNPHAPLLAVQLTAFECGGLALGLCVSHKLTDGFTRASFLNNWTSTARGHHHHHLPDFSEAPTRFPTIDPLPNSMASVYEDVWFGQSTNFKTERFVFGAEAVAAVKKRGASEAVPKPTRVQALSGFIWKAVMEASRKASPDGGDTVRSRVIAHAVNIRTPREKQHGTTSTVTSIGNLFWWAIAFYYDECTAKDGDVLSTLVELVSESISEVNSGYMKSLQGEEAMEVVTGHLKQIEEIYSVEEPEIFGFTSWVNLGLKDTDFGWGKPVWVGVFGEVGSSFRNLTVLNDAASGGGIEAWVTLEDKVLDNLKNDVEFLAMAEVNPPILMP